MMNYRRVIALLVVLAIVGCSKRGLIVQSDYDKTTNFSKYKTWDWLPDGETPTGNRNLDDPKVKERIRNVIDGQMMARGYVLDKSDPDLYVNYQIVIGLEYNERRMDNYYEYSHYTVFYPHWTSTYQGSYETGTILLDFFDVDKKKLVWSGFARSEFNPQAGPRENEPKLKEAVSEMLDQYPPKRK